MKEDNDTSKGVEELDGKVERVKVNPLCLSVSLPTASSCINELLAIQDIIVEDGFAPGNKTASCFINDLIHAAGDVMLFVDDAKK